MKKKIVTLLIATTAMLSLVGCGSTYDKYVSIKDYKNMKITDTNLSQFDYSDEDVNNTIRSSIINYSPNLITETNEAINEKSCISFEMVLQQMKVEKNLNFHYLIKCIQNWQKLMDYKKVF